MSDHPSPKTLARLLRGELSASTRLEGLRHLEACGDCALSIGEKTDLDGAAWRLASVILEGERHPEHDSLVDFVDGRLSPAAGQPVRAHVLTCTTCREDVDDLQTLQKTLSQHDGRTRRGRQLWMAVAASLLLSLSALWVMVRKPSPAPPLATRPQVSVAKPVPVPQSIPQSMPLARPREWQQVVERATSRRRIEPPKQLTRLLVFDEVETDRGSTAFVSEPLTPNREIIQDDRPLFRWKHRAGSVAVVRVFQRERQVAASMPVSGGAWRTPTALERGEAYWWQVEITVSGATTVVPAPPQSPAMFAVLDSASSSTLERARRERPTDHLLLGVLYANAGLRREAEQELEVAARLQPGDAAPRELLGSLRAWRR